MSFVMDSPLTKDFPVFKSSLFSTKFSVLFLVLFIFGFCSAFSPGHGEQLTTDLFLKVSFFFFFF